VKASGSSTDLPPVNNFRVEDKMANISAQTNGQANSTRRLVNVIGTLALCSVAMLAGAAPPVQKTFVSPEEGVNALVDAVRANDVGKLRAVLGPHSGKLVKSGDEVADARGREGFLKEYGEASKIVLDGDTKATLMIGNDEWPLPIPLVKSGERWRFDAAQGEQELLARRIGANELAAIQVCLAIVDAENEYAAQVKGGDGVPHYAARFVSSPGKRDGLYWDPQPDGPPSPLGPLLAAASDEGYVESGARVLAPYHGYYYKILTSQGADAPGGAYDYLVKGKMIGGFAVLAWPARYGASGVMSFMVNHEGVVYEKDLGRQGSTVAAKVTSFNPDESWKKQ
jgi:hypothetical protein